MNMRKALGIMLMMLPLAAFAQDAINGTWKIDLNKLQMDSKPQVFELKDGMYSCSTCDPKVMVKADGQDQAVTGNPYADTLSVKVIDANTIERVGKKDGKISFRETLAVSADGKSSTFKYEGHPAGGSQTVNAAGMYSRVGEPEAGAHAVSGSWKVDKWDSVSDNALTFTYAMTGDGVNFKASTGENYSAKFDGKDYPFHGDPGTTSVVLKRIDANTFEETYKRNGEVTGSSRMTISPDGKSLSMVSQDMRRGTTDRMVAEKASNGEQMADK
jgi:hypothetical protein